MEYQRLVPEHTSFWSSFYKSYVLHLMFYFPEKDGYLKKKVHNLVLHFSEQFKNYYVPPKNVSIDESLIGYKGRGLEIKYMSNKHYHHFSFKLFCENESRYTFNFSFYEGKQSSSSDYGISHNILLELMAPFLVKGIISLQTIGTAVHLAESLLLKGKNLTGTVRLNRKYLPADVKKKLAKRLAFRKNRLLCMGWQHKKHVILISTEGSSKIITDASK